MKTILLISSMSLLFTFCTPSDNGMMKRVVCGDSIDTELVDSLGNTYTVRTAGPCDTIIVDADSLETMQSLMEIKIK